jgi:aryl-alcohol dehydrogenase-like predicted oxidoreductase
MRSGLAAEGVTPTQLALAWVLSRGDDVVPSPWDERAPLPRGESVAAVDVELTAADLERIEWAFPNRATAGDRSADISSVGG